MIELKVDDYDKVIASLQNMNINNLFAKSIIYQHLPGLVYVDDENEPSVFYIAHPYGMSLLFGSTTNEGFNRDLYFYMTNRIGHRKNSEWLQVSPDPWNNMIKTILGSELVENAPSNDGVITAEEPHKKVEKYTRVNFAFDRVAYGNISKDFAPQNCKIVKTTKEMFCDIQGSVVPKCFWKDEEHFAEDGIGYSLIYNGEIAATAFSSFRVGNQLELGIETSEKYRGKGLAFKVCVTIIDYCLENGLEPVWSCRKENEGSYRLALKLGFVPTISIPYYRLAI